MLRFFFAVFDNAQGLDLAVNFLKSLLLIVAGKKTVYEERSLQIGRRVKAASQQRRHDPLEDFFEVNLLRLCAFVVKVYHFAERLLNLRADEVPHQVSPQLDGKSHLEVGELVVLLVDHSLYIGDVRFGLS